MSHVDQDAKEEMWRKLTAPRREHDAPPPKWRQHAHELLQRAVDAEEACCPCSGECACACHRGQDT